MSAPAGTESGIDVVGAELDAAAAVVGCCCWPLPALPPFCWRALICTVGTGAAWSVIAGRAMRGEGEGVWWLVVTRGFS